MAVIESKYIEVAYNSPGFGYSWGYNSLVSPQQGDVNDTQNGSTAKDVSGLFSGEDLVVCQWSSFGYISFTVTGNHSNSGFDTFKVGNTTFNRSDATFSPDTTNGRTSWFWTSSTNLFGTTAGADILVEWDDGQAATDTTPNAFSFTDVTGASLSTTQTSNQITISGMDTGASATVTVTGGTYSKNGGSYTSSAGTASNGDTFRVRHTSSSSYSTAVNTTLTIGGVSDTYTSTTSGADTTPDAFTFTDVTGVARSSTSVSNEITVAGLDGGGVSTGVSITGGEYSKNSGAYTSSAGTAVNGDKFKVRHTTSSSFSTATNTTLNIGGVTDTYTSTTLAADSTPNGFTFTDVTGVSQSTTQTSNTITVSGINTTATVTITGGTYSKNGGAYTSASGTASNGDTFAVRHTSGGDFSTSVSTTLNIGGISDTYTSTTAAFGGSTYYVDVSATYDGELNTIFLFVTGTGAGGTQANPKRIDPGDRVGFKKSGSPTVVAKLFNSAHWTDSNNITLGTSYTYKYAKSTIPTTTADAVTVEATYSGATNSSIQWFIGDSGITAPVISSVSTDNAAAANVTATVNLSSNGSGGTLKFAQSTTNSVPATGWQTSASFSHPRGTTRYYWASQDEDSGYAYDGPKTVTIGYLLPDLDVSATSSTISGSATTATTNVTNGNTTDTYAVRVNNGTVNLASRTGNGSMTWSTNLPGNGGTVTYEIFSRRPTSTGGNGTTFYQTNDTFTVTRELTPSAPTDIVFSADPGTESATVSITATASGGSGGTLQVSEDASTWVANGSSFTFTRGTAKTIYARRLNGSTPSTTNYSESNTVSYLLPDLAVAATSSTIASGVTEATTTLSNATAGETYAVRVNNGATNLDTRVGNGDLTFTDSLPNAGTTATYEIFARRPVSTGGDGSTFYATNDTFTVSRDIGPPVISTVTHNNASSPNVTATVNLSDTGAGGTLKYAQTTTNSVPATGWQTSASFTQARNTTRYYWASRDEDTAGTYGSSASLAVGYIAPDTAVTATDAIISATATSATTTIANGRAVETYAVRVNNGSTNLGTRTGNGDITFTSSLPAQGTTDTYEIFALRPTSAGGDGAYDATNDTFTVQRQADVTPNAFTFTDVTGVSRSTTQTSNEITVSGLTSGTSVSVSVTGGTYSKNGAAYTSAAGTATNTDTFRVRHTSSSAFSGTVSTTLNIGGIEDTYSSTTLAADTTPAAFSFTDTTGVARSTTQTSNQITITGINTTTSVSITGGTYSRNGGAYTSASATNVSNNDTFTVRHTSSAAFSTATNTTLTVGGVSDTFTSTTLAADSTPDAFTFTDVTGVDQSTTQTSNTITVAGINTSATVTVSGGTYSKNGGAYTATAGTASNGDTFSVRHTSAGDYSTQTSTTLTIGGVSDTYSSTTAAFTGSTYYVDVTARGTHESPQDVFVTLSITGTGWTTNTAGKQLNPGDRVGFKNVTSGITLDGGPVDATVNGFASTHWTNTGSLILEPGEGYEFKYAKSTIPVDSVDTVTVGASYTYSGNTAGTTQNGYYVGASLSPDTSITLNTDTVTITPTATSHQITITEASPNNNSSDTKYRVVDSNSSHESRTGPGTITVTDVPSTAGFPKNYSIQAMLPQADGGSGLWVSTGDTYQVVATTTASSNGPTEGSYGMSVYDHQGNLVTSFQEGHTTLRKLYSNSSVTLSTTGTTTVSTGLSGITSSNCVILVEQSNASGTNAAPNTPARFTGSGTISVELARSTTAATVKVTVAQIAGTTIGATESYGFQVKNGDDVGVIDENSSVYAVREIIDINPASQSSQSLYQNESTNFVYVTLTQGRYPASGGCPIPAVSCSQSVFMIPPVLSNIKHSDGSYKTVILYLPKGATITNYKLAMLVDQSTTDPIYFGGSEPDYGVKLLDSSSNVVWHSGWRQAIINNVIAANQFTAGTNQNGNYDVTTGYDGVTGGATLAEEFDIGLDSTGQQIGVSNLNSMDPSKTYLLGLGVQGFVHYRTGRYLDREFNIDERRGGGRHLPAIRISSTTSATMTMWRFSRGFDDPDGDYATRDPNSKHPDGNFILARIV